MTLWRHGTQSVLLCVPTQSLGTIDQPGFWHGKGKPDGGGNGGGNGGGGGGGDTVTIQIVADGAGAAVTASQECEEDLSASTTSLLCNKAGYQIMLSDFFVNRDYDNGHGSTCFNNGIWDWVTIQLWENKDGTAEAWFRWHALDARGDDVLYVLEVYDYSGWSPDFPPLSAGTVSISGDDWTLRAANKRQSRNACVGNGSFTAQDFVNVSLIRLP